MQRLWTYPQKRCQHCRKWTHIKNSNKKSNYYGCWKEIKYLHGLQKIVLQSSIAKVANIKLNATNFVFDGKIKTPVVTVKDSNGKILKKNIHYSVTYAKGRKNVGRYAVVVKLRVITLAQRYWHLI